MRELKGPVRVTIPATEEDPEHRITVGPGPVDDETAALILNEACFVDSTEAAAEEAREVPLEEMTAAELRVHATENGIDIKGKRSKKDLLAAIQG